MQTSVENVYAAGDVTGNYQLTPVARMEGIVAARNMADYPNKISYNCIPQSISLNMDVSFVENEKIIVVTMKSKYCNTWNCRKWCFWKILTGDTGHTKIEFDKRKIK